MAEFVLKESQVKLIKSELTKESDLKLAEENWKNFSDEEREFVVEFLKSIYPEKSKLLKESWYNTLGDIVGIFDPTGVVDLVNGISYISQGENLFGFLSLISAVPYVGDFVAKPVMGLLKVGAPSAKSLNNVLKLSKAGKSAEAAKELARISSSGGITGKFVRGFGQVGGKLRGFIERTPVGMFKGLKNTILQWIDLFGNAAKAGSKTRKVGQRLANRFTTLSPQLQAKNLENLIKMSKSTSGAFTGYRTSKGLMSWKTVFGGMPQLMGRNKSVRALMRQSKWWLGFLDYIGLGNWVGPEELAQKLGGEEEMRQKMDEYNKTPEAEQNFKDQYGSEDNESTETTGNSTSNTKTGGENLDPLAKFLRGLLTGQLNPIPGI